MGSSHGAEKKLPQREVEARAAVRAVYYESPMPMSLLPPSSGAALRQRGERGPLLTAAAFAASLALVIVVSALSYRSIVELQEAARWIEHTERVIGNLQKLKVSVAQVYAASCGFVLDQSPRHDEAVLGHRREVWTTLADVRTLTADNASQQRLLAALGHQLAERFTSLDRALHPRPRDGGVPAAPDSAVVVADDSAIAEAIEALIDAERTLLAVRQEHEAASSRRANIAIFGASALALLLALATLGSSRRSARIRLEFEEERRRFFERASEQLKLRTELLGMLNSCETSKEAGSVIESFLVQLFPGSSGALYVAPPGAELLAPLAAWGGMDTREFALNACWALRRRHPHRTGPGGDGASCDHPHGPAAVCVPLLARGDAFGVVVLSPPAGEARLDANDHLILRLADDLSLALANLRLRESLRHLSVRDALTGLFNRRYLEETLEREVHRATREGKSLGMLLLDLDHFKRLNDTLGHQAGDEALRAVGDLLARSIRAGDVACRFGGEEFVILLPGATLDGATRRAEHLRGELAELAVSYRGEELAAITASIGVAALPEIAGSATALLRAADTATYRAKHEGRDRIAVAERSTGERAASSQRSPSVGA
jgi:diguanylate cyclase (GGDEF)-like protein